MFSRDDFLDAIATETRLCIHLHGKIDDDQLEYRPVDGMRTSLELLRYLTYAAAGPMDSLVHGTWDAMGARVEKASTMAAAEFPERMEAQLEECRKIVAGLSDEDLGNRRVTLPWGEEGILGPVLVSLCLRFLTAYRMQLFVYAKAGGHPELSTYNCWMGIDAPAPG